MLTADQIEAMVKAKYPKTEKESWCATEKKYQNDRRDIYREELKAQQVDAVTLN